jgi:hypothetical protein
MATEKGVVSSDLQTVWYVLGNVFNLKQAEDKWSSGPPADNCVVTGGTNH